MATKAFSSTGDAIIIAASTTSASAALPGTVGTAMRAYNATSAVAHFRVGVGAPTAVATDQFLAPGATEIFSIPVTATHAAVILSSGTGNVYFQRGDGL